MPRQLFANSAAVATGHPLGAAAGREMLAAGGNAVDAAVAATLALCVAIPGSVGLGGYGGSAVVFDALTRRVLAFDFDSCAPLDFREGLVTADKESNYYGARSVTVPAVVAGLEMIRSALGTKSWSEVLQPAIRLADDGFDVDAEHRKQLERCAPMFDPQSLASLVPGGRIPEIGARWRQPRLARLLRRLADDGPGSFYTGEIARTIVDYVRGRGGILREEDFREYCPKSVSVLRAVVRGNELCTPPPPSGGVTSLAIVQSVDQYLKLDNLEPHSGRYFHVLGEATKRCWSERHQWLGDPDFVNVPLDELISEERAKERAAEIRRGGVFSHANITNAAPHTSNVVACDAAGNLISLTATQGWMYGSHLVVDRLGLVLNHGMSRFDYVPGHPNNPAPGKRMQHNMSPMIALRDGHPISAFGLPGGPKIVNVTAQLALNTFFFGASPADAISTPRLHSTGEEPLMVSRQTPSAIVDELNRLGHLVGHDDDMGGPVNVLRVDPQTGTIDVASGEGTGAVAAL